MLWLKRAMKCSTFNGKEEEKFGYLQKFISNYTQDKFICLSLVDYDANTLEREKYSFLSSRRRK